MGWVLTAVWTAQHPHTSSRFQWGLRPPRLELWEKKKSRGAVQKDSRERRRGGGQEIKCHTSHGYTVRFRDGGVKPGKEAWEINRGAQVHNYPAEALHTPCATPPSPHVISYSNMTFSFLTRWDKSGEIFPHWVFINIYIYKKEKLFCAPWKVRSQCWQSNSLSLGGWIEGCE